MIHRIIDIRTDGLSAFEKESRRLVLCLEYCCLIIALVDKETGYWVAVEVLQCAEEDLEDMENLMAELKQQSSLINYTGLDTKIFLRTPNTMMVPAYLQRDAKRFLDLQFGPHWDVVVTESVNGEMTAALKTNSGWINPFLKVFPQATLHSSLGWLTKQSLEETAKSGLPVIQMVFSNGLVEMVVVKNNELMIATCFRFNAVEDMNYYFLNTCNQLNVKPGEIQVKVQGLLETGSPLYESLLKYVLGIQFVNASLQDWGPQFKTIPAHYFTGLINAS